jgi:hypothetical protein
MADSKITALTALTAADPVNDMFPVVDVSDTSMAASGTTKKISVNNILGASGTATLASATITGALTVDTTTLVVDATNDRVGIGTATPSSALHVNLAEVSSAAGTTAIITNTTGGGNRIAALRLNNLSNQWNIRAYGAVTDDLRIGAGATGSEVDYLAIGNTGNVNVALGNVVMATSGKGIDFSATANSSGTMTSELLNDYEEGTWTGTLSGGTTNPTIPVTGTGRYTKVGRVVTVQITFNNENTLGASGLLGITGLPFTNNASVNAVGSVNFYNIATFTGSPFVALGAGQSSLVCYSNISNSVFGNVTHNASASGNYFTASITYTV